ncbi:MarR family transcriptional regulator [Leucobacter sp. Psy1]|uniref:transcriptional regulator n=1 Tax=Leucobacter sp. Psy1 TaxID=2875729 RepID=UPI001CD36820|nr:transcriptional regulator [Leucobacter sp. Psy1]UBH07294.1 MarR family transcriptional regulator [Leucobacter sp. Psy1]
MPDAAFNPLIHAPHRLRICAMLSQADGVEFGEILERIGLTKSALSKQIGQLADAGYVTEEAIVRDRRSRQLLSLTPSGREAYAAHKAALQQLIEAPDRAPSTMDA